MKLIKRRYIYICSLLLFIGGFAYLIIDFRLFPFHMIFTVCLTGLLLQIYEKKNPKIFLMGAVGYIFIGLSSIFVYIPSKTLLLYELLNLNSGAQVLFSTAFIFAMLPIGYTLLTIASNKAGILDNVVSIGLAIIFVVNFMPYLIVPRILFGLAITILGYLSLQNL